MPRSEPQRSCLGCRTVKDKSDLLRFVLTPERVLVPDLLNKLPGRGAYTCPNKECVKKAVERKQFHRAFKGEVTTGSAVELTDRIVVLLEGRLESYLSLANKAGKVVSGSDRVMEALKKQVPGVVLVAKDISPDIGEKIADMATRTGVEQLRISDKERLGALLGKELRSVAAIEKGGFVETIVKELEKYRNFFEGGAQAR